MLPSYVPETLCSWFTAPLFLPARRASSKGDGEECAKQLGWLMSSLSNWGILVCWAHSPAPGISLNFSAFFWLSLGSSLEHGLSWGWFLLCPKPCTPGSGADQKLPLDGRAGELRELEIWLEKQNLKNTQSLAFPATTAESLQGK